MPIVAITDASGGKFACPPDLPIWSIELRKQAHQPRADNWRDRCLRCHGTQFFWTREFDVEVPIKRLRFTVTATG